jgi:hypothetical protein
MTDNGAGCVRVLTFACVMLAGLLGRTQYMRWLGLVVFLLFADVLAVPLLIFGFLYKNRVKV